MTGKIPKIPKAKLISAIRKYTKNTKIKQKRVIPLVWLQYLLVMQRLAVAAQEKAKEEKKSVINADHIKAVSKKVLQSCKA